MKLVTTLFLVLIPFITFSQANIKGAVLDEIGVLSGANIVIKNSKIGTISDIDGNFKIKVKPTDTLLISYVGYTSKEIAVRNKKDLSIVLGGNVSLDEVFVVGYGTSTKTFCKTVCCRFTTNCYTISKDDSIKNFKSDLITEKLYPNPSKTGRFQLKLIKDYKTIDIQVSNMSGQLVKNFSSQPKSKRLDVDLSSFKSGLYIVNIIVDGKVLAAKKAIIQ